VCVLSCRRSQFIDMAFYLMPSRLWQLASGAILFHWQMVVLAPAISAPEPPPPSGARTLALLLVDLINTALLALGFWYTDPK
jgi:hypothetical protein